MERETRRDCTRPACSSSFRWKERFDDDAPTVPSRPQDQVLADLAALHQRFDDEQISFDDFEDAKAGLLAELQLG